MFKINKKHWENIFCFFVFYTFIFFSSNSFSADSLSYSGRLVKADGSPVASPVNLKIDLAYTDFPNTILCSQNFTGVVLSNGVFHLKLDLVCPGPPAKTVTEILSAVPATFSAALRVSDVTNSKIYAFQEIHSMPFAAVSESAKQLAQLGAVNGEVLKWNDTTKKWEPGTPGGGGTVTNVTTTAPLAVTSGATTPALTITKATTTTDGYLSATDWNTFNNKVGVATGGTTAQYYRGDNSWQMLDSSVVPESGVTNLYFSNARVLGVPLDGFVAGPGVIVATDTVLQAFAKAQGQINLINTNSSAYVTKTGTSTLAAGTIDAQAGFVLVGAPGSINDATPRGYVDTQVALKLSKAGDTMSGALTLDNDLLIKGGSNYVTLKGHATTAAYNFILPSSAGLVGEVLKTDGAGNLSWVNPSSLPAGAGTVDSVSITDDSIMNADINSAAAIDQSKISGLVSALSGKQTTALATGNILVGSAGGVATAVSVSGDAALSTLGALTLTNTGVVADTYKSVTVDAKGRVASGTNPTTLAGFGITDTLVTNVTATAPITITGTTAPLIAMPAATNAVDGYLTAADRTAFNAKQDTITASSILNSREIRFNELTGNGAEYISLKAPDALTANTSYTLPAADGTTGQVLTTNAAGILSWSTVATSGTTLAGDVGGTIGANLIGTGKVTSTHLLDGSIVNADINAAAAIDYSKLNIPALAIPLTALNATGTKDATKYLKGDNTWSVLQTDVQALLLSSYTLGTNAVVATGDSIVSAFGKLQKQITDLTTRAVGGDLTGNLPNPSIAKIQGSPISITTPATKQVLKYNGTTWVNAQVAAADLSATGTVNATTYLAGDNSWKSFNSGVIAAPITGVNTTGITKATSAMVGTDSLLTAFNKLLFTQGDYVSKSADQTMNGILRINSLTGFIEVPTPTSANEAANKGYVDSYGQWLEGTGGNINDIYFSTGKVGIGTTTPQQKLVVQGGNTALNSIGNASPQYEWRASDNSLRAYISHATETVGATTDENRFYQQYGFKTFYTQGAERVRIDSSGNVGIGTTSPANNLEVAYETATFPRGITSTYYNNNTWGSYFVGQSAAGTKTAPSATVIGKNLTSFVGRGYGATGWTTLAGDLPGMSIQATENFTDSAMGSRIKFFTVPNGTNTASERMAIDQNGNVGIGTTTPTTSLDISNTGGETIVLRDNNNLVTDVGYASYIRAKDSAGTNAWYIGDGSSSAAGTWLLNYQANPIHFGTDSTTRMSIDGTGNVGIGTTLPNFTLDVPGSFRAAGTARMTLSRTMTNVLGDTVALGSLSNNAKATWARIRLNAHNGGNIDAVIFEVYLPAYQHITTTTGWQELPTLAGSSGWQGNIAYIVDVYRQDPLNATAPFFFRVRNRNGTGNGALDVVIEYDDHSTFTAYTTASNVATAFNNVTAPAGGPIDGFYGGWAYSFPVSQGHAWNASTGAGLFIKNSGNVGIGTADPSYTLHVVGSAGLSSGTAWTNASDIRLKDVHNDYEYGLNEILKLHTVRYSYKKDNPLGLPSDFSKTGFIAQEVQKVIPDAVTKRKDGYLELNVDPIHWAVVNSIKDLYRKHILPLWESDRKQERAIASLEEENKKLKDENKDIRERLLRLEKNMMKNK